MNEISDYWNHNVHYQPLILDAVPTGCRVALDVGCGDGLLACRLAARCGTVIGIDSDAPMIVKARDRARVMDAANVTFIEADFMAVGLRPCLVRHKSRFFRDKCDLTVKLSLRWLGRPLPGAEHYPRQLEA
jgi:SAM-dependent methyltransferase